MDLRVKNLFVCVLLMMFLSGCGNKNVETGPGPAPEANKKTEAPARAAPQDGTDGPLTTHADPSHGREAPGDGLGQGQGDGRVGVAAAGAG